MLAVYACVVTKQAQRYYTAAFPAKGLCYNSLARVYAVCRVLSWRRDHIALNISEVGEVRRGLRPLGTPASHLIVCDAD